MTVPIISSVLRQSVCTSAASLQFPLTRLLVTLQPQDYDHPLFIGT